MCKILGSLVLALVALTTSASATGYLECGAQYLPSNSTIINGDSPILIPFVASKTAAICPLIKSNGNTIWVGQPGRMKNTVVLRLNNEGPKDAQVLTRLIVNGQMSTTTYPVTVPAYSWAWANNFGWLDVKPAPGTNYTIGVMIENHVPGSAIKFGGSSHLTFEFTPAERVMGWV